MPSLQLMPYFGQTHLRRMKHSDNVSDPRETRYASIRLYFLPRLKSQSRLKEEVSFKNMNSQFSLFDRFGYVESLKKERICF